jgi:hypothetical protein
MQKLDDLVVLAAPLGRVSPSIASIRCGWQTFTQAGSQQCNDFSMANSSLIQCHNAL